MWHFMTVSLTHVTAIGKTRDCSLSFFRRLFSLFPHTFRTQSPPPLPSPLLRSLLKYKRQSRLFSGFLLLSFSFLRFPLFPNADEFFWVWLFTSFSFLFVLQLMFLFTFFSLGAFSTTSDLLRILSIRDKKREKRKSLLMVHGKIWQWPLKMAKF